MGVLGEGKQTWDDSGTPHQLQGDKRVGEPAVQSEMGKQLEEVISKAWEDEHLTCGEVFGEGVEW